MVFALNGSVAMRSKINLTVEHLVEIFLAKPQLRRDNTIDWIRAFNRTGCRLNLFICVKLLEQILAFFKSIVVFISKPSIDDS